MFDYKCFMSNCISRAHVTKIYLKVSWRVIGWWVRGVMGYRQRGRKGNTDTHILHVVHVVFSPVVYLCVWLLLWFYMDDVIVFIYFVWLQHISVVLSCLGHCQLTLCDRPGRRTDMFIFTLFSLRLLNRNRDREIEFTNKLQKMPVWCVAIISADRCSYMHILPVTV